MKRTKLSPLRHQQQSLKAVMLAIGFLTLLLPLLWPATEAGEVRPAVSPSLPPAPSDILQIPPGNRLAFCLCALGVQVYRWTGTSWDFMSPLGLLFGNARPPED
jgi:hypothetical protein